MEIMQEGSLHVWAVYARGGAAVSAGVWILMIYVHGLFREKEKKKLILERYVSLRGMIRQRGSGADHTGLEDFLKRNGAGFHYGAWVDPVRYTLMRLGLGAMGVAAGSVLGTGWGLLTGVILYLLPHILLRYLNVKDNERLLPELKLVYNTLSAQIRAGVYMSDALAECYGCVKERRLRQGLLELSGDIVMKSRMAEALEEFQKKFDNSYIDALCITLLQAMDSGQAIELLSDMAEQIKDMEAVLLERKKAALDRKFTFYQLGILAAVLMIVLYACISRMFETAISF